MKEDVLSMTIGVDIVYEVWTSLKEQLLPIPIEKKWFTEEYLRDFKIYVTISLQSKGNFSKTKFVNLT